jgi:hypothetical protein
MGACLMAYSARVYWSHDAEYVLIKQQIPQIPPSQKHTTSRDDIKNDKLHVKFVHVRVD